MSREADRFVQQVREGLNQYLQDNPEVRLADMATGMGYSPKTLQMFRGGSCQSVRLAVQVAGLIPEAAGAWRCPYCRGIHSQTYTPRKSR